MKNFIEIYCGCSWILGLLMIVILFSFGDDDFLLLFYFLNGFNAIINFIFIVFHIIMIYVFPENRKGFLSAILMLSLNFPSILVEIILMYLLLTII